ncbi:unnamed protein product [Linum tenue]|uniref:TIR domain-containing protein n=1 Tax=Linum tenue TaxID=586396 RepID=A0AAV0JTX6_9ROSI|nr:unnamed protein product [Linum tenue]
MDYMKWAVTVIGLLLPLLIILYKLWLGRRISNRANNVDNASRTLDSIASASGSADSDTLLPLPFGEYEVFMNFRGPDTRYQITDILFRFLVNLKIRTFKDDDELRKGEGIWPNLVEAIEQSKIYVTIFSENYAYSKWCLKELAVIVEHQERNQGCIILPIFYMVDPRDVRHQSGPYLRAFRQHENFFDEETIRIWKAALNKVGALKGWHVKSNDEQGAIADLVTGIVWSHLSKNNFLETDKLIGMDDHIEVVKERLALDSPCMTIVGIHGIGGIGKTTIAKAVYNKVSPQFDRCSFVEDVREMLQQRDGIIILQKHIISDILRVKNFAESIANNSAGIRIIKDRISRFKFLIVLDDVDEKFRFDKILGNIKNFVSGSRFIITSRNVKVLSTLTDDCKLYKVLEMNHSHALQLFCNHSFKQDSPPSSYETLSNDIVSVAAGLPLTLKVVGSLLFQEEKVIWEDKLRQLKEIPEEEVVERLKISYDTLNEEAKQIFLDIACFFIGEDKDLPSYMWSDCDFFPISNINILRQRSMIEIASHDYHKMHDQLRDMGREIVRQENTRHPWKRSRIWSKGKALDMLCNQKGSNLVESIRIRHSGAKLGKIQKECFMNLSELRYLEIEASMLIDDFSNYVPSLRWLRWSIGFSECIPKFSVENLVIFEVLGFVRDMSEALRHIKIASKLKVLKLSRCWLDEFPEFPRSGSLEILDLREIIGGTVGMMPFENLKVLHLQDCGVRELTCGTFGMMPNLENLTYLSIGGCPFLKEILGLVGLKSLETLRICDMKALRNVDGFESLYSLKSLTLRCCDALERLPSMGSLSNLLNLYISNCHGLTEIQDLDLGIGNFGKLKVLRLKSLWVREITGGTGGMMPSSLTTLHIKSCSCLVRLPTLENLENLTVLSIECCYELEEILGLGGLKSLETLSICHMDALGNVDGLDSLYSLKSLTLRSCDALERLPSMASLSKLLHLEIDSCLGLTEIHGLGGLESLQMLHIYFATILSHLFGFETLLSFNKLKALTLRGCPVVTLLPLHDLDDDECGLKVAILDSLQELDIRGTVLMLQIFCRMIKLLMFPSLTQLTLTGMEIGNADRELSLDGLESMEELVELHLGDLTALRSLPSLSKLGKLKRITIDNAPKLRKIEGVTGLKSLEELDLTGCTSLERWPVDELSCLEKLKILYIAPGTSLIDRSALRRKLLKVSIRSRFRLALHLDGNRVKLVDFDFPYAFETKCGQSSSIVLQNVDSHE